tara:strand:- start:496 stop:972 length:477 start_codon:yes stop_codon:yes gene_type:complete
MGNSQSEFDINELPEGPWTNDLKNYPSTDEDHKNNKNLYNFKYNYNDMTVKVSLKRNALYSWCGYVEFPTLTHPDYGKSVEDLEKIYLVHGNITFSDGGKIGFDCCNFNDISPLNSLHNDNYLVNFTSNLATYKDYQFAKNELVKLAKQVIDRQKINN